MAAQMRCWRTTVFDHAPATRCALTPWPPGSLVTCGIWSRCCCTPWPRLPKLATAYAWDLVWHVAAVGHLRALVLHGQLLALCRHALPAFVATHRHLRASANPPSHHPCPIQELCPQHHQPAIFASKSSGSATMRSLSSGPCASSHL